MKILIYSKFIYDIIIVINYYYCYCYINLISLDIIRVFDKEIFNSGGV